MIQQLISGTYIYQGDAVQVPVKSVVIDSGLATKAKQLIEESGLKGRGLLVCDKNTYDAMGKKIALSTGINDDNSIIFTANIKPDIKNVEEIKKIAYKSDYIIAVGGGTINDLCKFASYELNVPYIIFGTAPSMNGYGSANASIIVNDHKKTLKAQLPHAIFLDLEVLASAPIRLIRSGLGDSICRSTAQADWLLSHLLLDTYYNGLPFELLKGIEQKLFSSAANLKKGDISAIRLLTETLVLSGFGMYLAGGSYPASQGEHMIAHTMEMLYSDSLPQTYHGEQIGVATLTMARLQHDIINSRGVRVKKIRERGMKGGGDNFPLPLVPYPLSPEMLAECSREYQFKQFSPEKLDGINHRFETKWGKIKSKISVIAVSCEELEEVLRSAGCPIKPEDIGWDSRQYQQAVDFAKYTRNRFTFLDL